MVSNLERILMERGAKLPKSTKQAHRERQEAREILAITQASTNRANIIGRSRPNIMRGCLRIVKSAVFANRILHLEFFPKNQHQMHSEKYFYAIFESLVLAMSFRRSQIE